MGMLFCDGEFSGVSIRWYSSVHVLESPLERERICGKGMNTKTQQNKV